MAAATPTCRDHVRVSPQDRSSLGSVQAKQNRARGASVIRVIGAAGTIGAQVCAFLADWDEDFARLDARLEGKERVDVADAGVLVRSLEGSSVCVNCVDYRLNLGVMEAALAAACHYLDLGGLFHMTRRQLELDDRFREAGLTAILGMGSAPGKTNLLARAAVERLGTEPDELEIWAA